MRHWTAEEVLTLARYGFLHDVAPEDLLWLRLREGKRSIAKHAHDIKPRNQESMFSSWVGVGIDLWTDRRWRSCLVMRYRRGDEAAIGFLPLEWKRQLESAAKRFRAKLKQGPVPKEDLEATIGRTIPAELLNDAYNLLAFEYLESLVLGTWGPKHRLNLSVTESRLFERVLEFSQSAVPKEFRHIRPGDFLNIIAIRGGHATEIVGKVCYYLYLLDHEGSMEEIDLPEGIRAIWPDRLKFSEIVNSDDFKYVADKFVGEYGVNRDALSEIRMAFLTENIRNVYRLRERADQAVFWAAKILSVIAPDVFMAYKLWVDLFRQRVFSQIVQWNEDRAPSAQERYAILNPWQTALLENPLLNCVFHTIVLDGMNRIDRMNPQGRPTNHVEGVSVAFAVERFRRLRIPKKKKHPRALLVGRGLSPSERVKSASQSCDDLSIHSLVAPLITAILPFGSWVYGRREVYRIWREYKDHPDVRRLQKDLGREFSEAVSRKRRQ